MMSLLKNRLFVRKAAWETCVRKLSQKNIRTKNMSTFYSRFGYASFKPSRGMLSAASHDYCRSSVHCFSVISLFVATRVVPYPPWSASSNSFRDDVTTSAIFSSEMGIQVPACRKCIGPPLVSGRHIVRRPSMRTSLGDTPQERSPFRTTWWKLRKTYTYERLHINPCSLATAALWPRTTVARAASSPWWQCRPPRWEILPRSSRLVPHGDFNVSFRGFVRRAAPTQACTTPLYHHGKCFIRIFEQWHLAPPLREVNRYPTDRQLGKSPHILQERVQKRNDLLYLIVRCLVVYNHPVYIPLSSVIATLANVACGFSAIPRGDRKTMQ